MNEITQKFEFKEWITTIIPLCSLVFSILSYFRTERIKREYEQRTKEFELYKEEKRQQDAMITSLLMKQKYKSFCCALF